MISCSIIPTIQCWDITEQFTKWAKHFTVVKQLYQLEAGEGRKKNKEVKKVVAFPTLLMVIVVIPFYLLH